MNEPTLADAVGAWRRGFPDDAERLVRALTARDPHDVDAHRLLQEILAAANRLTEAIDIARRVVEFLPRDAAAHPRLAELLSRAGDAAAAVGMLEKSLQIEPSNARALNNLGNLLTGLGRPEEAIDILMRAVASQPDYPAAFVNLGVAHARTGSLERAMGFYQRALTLNPRCREASLNLAGIYMRMNNPEAALTACDAMLAQDSPPRGARGLRAAALLALDRLPEALLAAKGAAAADPDDVHAFVTLGFAALRSGKLELALDAFETALRHVPTLAKAHAGRANTLEALGRAGDAIDAYHEALRLDPTDLHVFLSSGQMMLKLGNGTSALTAFEAILAVDRDHVAAKEGRAKALVSLGRHEHALHALTELKACAPHLPYLTGYQFYAQLCCCDWRGFESTSGDIAARVVCGERADVPLSFLAHSKAPEQQRICAQVYAASECSVETARATRAVGPDSTRLRIGYLSSDFRDHPVAQLAVGLIESHDRSKFETFGFCAAPDDGSELRRRLGVAFEHFEEVGTMPDQALAERIAALQIDILIDLGGHTFGSRTRVLAYRPAALQISFLGFPGTLGAEFVDYIVADRHVIPETERRHYAEQVIYLPDNCLPTDFTPAQPPPPRAAAGLPEDAFVFCCFNAPFKFTPEVFDGWMRVLHAVPAAVLWLREGSSAMQSNLAREAGARGVDPARLVYAPRVACAHEHRARFALADVFLDTTPYNAHTTASEALAAAVPVITRRGRTFASRVATSLLHAAGLGHLSVEDPKSYERLAIDLAHSPPTLSALKAHLRRVRTSAPLFDTRRFCRHLEDAFLRAAARQRRGERPDTLFVAPRS